MKKRYLINNKTKKQLEYPVRQFLITKGNFWEYFIMDAPDIPAQDDIQFALVHGFEQELGYISISELKPYIAAKSNDLSDVMPPVGYSWADA